MTCAQCDARELAHQVALLVCHRRSAIDCDGILAIFSLNSLKLANNRVQHLVPGGALQWTLFTVTTHEGIGQAIRMVHGLIGRATLRTEHAVIEWEVRARF